MSLERYAYPMTVKEAVALLADSERRAIAIGGGTAVAHSPRRGAAVLVDVTRCGIDRIESSGETIHIGASARAADIAEAELPGAAGSLLRDAALGLATQPLRNAITLGGNIMHLAAWADFPVALLALNATVHCSHMTQGDFDLPMAELVREHPQRVLPKGALLLGVTVPVLGEGCGSAYQRFRTSVTDYSLISVAAVVSVEGKRCVHAAVSVGAVAPRPVRSAKAEKVLLGSTLTRRTIAKAASELAQEVKVAPNYRMAPEVRRRILEVEVRRAMESAAERARGNS